AGERLEDDAREVVPVADEIGEYADEQRLLDEAGEDVVIGAPAPEQSGECHVDHDESGCKEGNRGASEANPAVDCAVEDLEDMVDDARAAHDATRRPARRGRGSQRGSRAIRTKPPSVSCLASASAAGPPASRAGMRDRAGRP